MKALKFLILLLLSTFIIADEYHEKVRPRKIEHISSRSLPVQNGFEGYNEFWLEMGQQILEEQLSIKLNEGKAKNVILFVGGGMSTQTSTAARMYLGGEELKLSFDSFPNVGMAKTYCVDR